MHEQPNGNADDGRVQRQFDWRETTPAIGVAEALSSANGRGPMNGEVLFDHIDTDALNKLLSRDPVPSRATALTVSFAVEGRYVTVGGDGVVVVTSHEHRR